MNLRVFAVALLSFVPIAAIALPGCGSDNGSLIVSVTTGDDDLRYDTFARVTVTYQSGKTQDETLKGGGDNGWGNGSVKEKKIDLQDPSAITAITVSIDEHADPFLLEGSDRWIIASLDATKYDTGTPECVLKGGSGTVDDKSRSLRFDTNGGGCGATIPGSTPTSNTIRFVITTGNDDLRGDSEANAQVRFTDGTSETVSLKSGAEPGWVANTTHIVQRSVASGGDLQGVTILLTSHDGDFENDDSWAISKVRIYLTAPPSPEKCEASGPDGQAIVVSDAVPFIVSHLGCPLPGITPNEAASGSARP